MQPAIVSNTPPSDLRPEAFERKPHGDVRLMIQIGDDDFLPLPQALAYGKAHESQEGRRVHTKRNFIRIPGVQKDGDGFARPGNARIDGTAPIVPASALNVA